MRICLITAGQPSTDPRLVKTADALTEAGHEVQVVASHWAAWANTFDQQILATRPWRCEFVGGRPSAGSIPYRWTRIRNTLSRHLATRLPRSRRLVLWSMSRVGPELERAALRARADVYIGHGLGGLLPAVNAARHWDSRCGYDAEDFEPGVGAPACVGLVLDQCRERIERWAMERCDFITAASDGIGQAYIDAYGIPRPTTILNVFPCDMRPSAPVMSGNGPLTLYWFSQTIGRDRGIEDVVRAMGFIGEPSVQLHLRGSWQGGYRQELDALAATCGVDATRIVTQPPARPDDMVRLAAQYDVGLALEPGTSVNNLIAVSNKIFTYVLAGNAVAATATTGQAPIMETLGSAGFCYKPGNADALGQQLDVWRRDRNELRLARQRSWEIGTVRYNWDQEKFKLLDVIDGARKHKCVPSIGSLQA